MRKLGWMAGVVCTLACLLSAAPTNAETAERFNGMCFSTVEEFVSGQDIPESVTADAAGNLYISQGSSILQRTPDGTLSVFSTLPLPIFALGLKVGPDGCVYAASTSLSEVPGAFVWRACAPGTAEVFADLDHSGAPNDLAFDDDGELFVTDPVLGRVWQVDSEGTPSVFIDDPLLEGTPDAPALLFRPLGANGIAFDKHQRFLYVSNTDQGSIVRIRVNDDEPAAEVFAENPELRGADGVAFDRAGTLYVAVNGLDALVSVDRHGEVELLAQGGALDSPSSLVFGATHATRHKLYVVSSAFMRTLGLKPGTPQPALLSTGVAIRGLGLP
ncbi:MAG TPA: SMP-30/gluconolactonase/LRE family protein [Polyangiaceae bacterium]|nr:SMP-30/gluconolactonase/LRE family protein [Polyangiaceae bacterium]